MTQQNDRNQDLKGHSGQGGQTQFRNPELDGQQDELMSGKGAGQAGQESRSFQGADSDPVEGGRTQGLSGGRQQMQSGDDGASSDGDEGKTLDDVDTQSDTSNI